MKTTTKETPDLELSQIIHECVEQCVDPVMVTDTSGQMIYVNAGFSATTGYAQAEALGKNPRILSSGATPQSTYHLLWTNLQKGLSWQGDVLDRKKDGSTFWEHLSISPIRNASGAIQHYFGVGVDITQRKKIEMELEESLLKLARFAQEMKHFSLMLASDMQEPILKVGSALAALKGLRKTS